MAFICALNVESPELISYIDCFKCTQVPFGDNLCRWRPSNDLPETSLSDSKVWEALVYQKQLSTREEIS